jgi:hypothetical protein
MAVRITTHYKLKTVTMGKKQTIRLKCGLEAEYEQWGKGANKRDCLEIAISDMISSKPLSFSELIALYTELKELGYEEYTINTSNDPYGSIDYYYITCYKVSQS